MHPRDMVAWMHRQDNIALRHMQCKSLAHNLDNRQHSNVHLVHHNSSTNFGWWNKTQAQPHLTLHHMMMHLPVSRYRGNRAGRHFELMR